MIGKNLRYALELVFLYTMILGGILVYSHHAHAATSQVNSVQQFGGGGSNQPPSIIVPEGNTAGFKTLIATSETGGNNLSYWNFADPSTSTNPYQVPAGQTFRISTICFVASCSTLGDCSIVLGTGTAAATNNSVTPPTGYFPWATTVPASNNATIFSQNTAGVMACFPFPMNIAQNLFPNIKTNVSAYQTVFYIGKETTP